MSPKRFSLSWKKVGRSWIVSELKPARFSEGLPALISLGVPALWVWRWDRSLSPPPADNTLLSLDPPPKDWGDRTAVWRAVSVPWAKAIHTSENVSDLLWGTRSHNIKAIQPLHVRCLQKPRGQWQPPRATESSDLSVHWVPKQRRTIENRINEWDDSLICSQAEVEATVFCWLYASYFSAVWISCLI